MPIPLFNSIASWILKKRIHQMELFMKYPNEVQNELLHELIKTENYTTLKQSRVMMFLKVEFHYVVMMT
jgi:hypothetical protein